MSESKKKKTVIEKLKEEKKGVEEELAKATKKQEQICVHDEIPTDVSGRELILNERSLNPRWISSNVSTSTSGS